MKRVIFTLFLIVTLASCGMEKEVDTKLVGVEFDASVQYGDYECRCKATAYGGGVFTLTVTEPKAIEGTTAHYDGDELSITYKGLSYKPQTELPCDNIADMLNDVVKNTSPAQKNGEQYELTGNTGGYQYTLTVAETGLPLYLSCPSADLFVEFSNVKIIDKAE